jgi:hypothetical protein
MERTHKPPSRYLKPLPSRLPRTLFWIGGVAVAVFSAVGIAVIVG